MAKVFHVAVRNPNNPTLPSHQPGATLDMVAPQATTYPEALDAIRRRYPSGISSHGARYLAGWPQQPTDEAGWVAEAVFEAVRLAERPELPSRLTSWFACNSIDDARAFVANYRRAVYVDIWEGEADVVHRANMGLLDALGLPVVAVLERAAAYWRGERGSAPAVWEVLVAPGMKLLQIVETTAA